ncbi:MAG: ABC transporter permease [Bifidobacteriaceae bacterium]|jgi:peptide/nickel transport system permease protein|nr:ABC transporter permease [Bifidobacteriaceae bacterium]
MTDVDLRNLSLEPRASVPERTPGQRRRNKRWWRGLALERSVGVAVLVATAAAAILVPIISRHDPNALVAVPMEPPSPLHPFGTDELGRDLMARVFTALRVDLGITLATVGLCLLVGVVYGTVAGLSPAWLRQIMQRFVDALMAIPYLILVLAIVAIARTAEFGFLPAGIGAMVLALAITGWANYARITAAQVQILSQRESVAAAQLLGYSRVRIVVRHMLPSVIGPSLALAGSHAVLVAAAAASLSFLGAGVVPPTAELGAIMHGGTPLLATAWWISVFPGIAIVVMGLGFSLIADSRSNRP